MTICKVRHAWFTNIETNYFFYLNGWMNKIISNIIPFKVTKIMVYKNGSLYKIKTIKTIIKNFIKSMSKKYYLSFDNLKSR